MEDWEDGPTPDLLRKEQPRSKWDDEDVDDNDIKESWEDEEEIVPGPKKPAENSSEKKGKEVEVDTVAEKLHRQRLVEEADNRSTTELFAKEGGDDKTIDSFIPKSDSDFLEYAELISHKLRPYERSYHYSGLLKEVLRLSMTALTGQDAKDVASSVSVIEKEKFKAEKEAIASKKKTGAKKKQLQVDQPDDDAVIKAYDGYDDYELM